MIIEKRISTDIKRLPRTTSASSLWIQDLIELVKIRNENVVKFTLITNVCMWNYRLCYSTWIWTLHR